MTPLKTFRFVAIAEAVTWALLLTGMFLKYVTETTELGVRIFGMVHGVVFIAYCLTALVVAVDQRWSKARALLGLAASIPPFFTVVFDRNAEKNGVLGTSWRLTNETGTGPVERLVSWLLRNPLRGALVGVVSVAVLTGVALVVGPPVG